MKFPFPARQIKPPLFHQFVKALHSVPPNHNGTVTALNRHPPKHVLFQQNKQKTKNNKHTSPKKKQHRSNTTIQFRCATFSPFSITDEDDEPRRCVQLTNQHKIAIRFIRKVNCAGFEEFGEQTKRKRNEKTRANDVIRMRMRDGWPHNATRTHEHKTNQPHQNHNKTRSDNTPPS